MTWFLFFCLTFSLTSSMESDINGTPNTIPDEYSQESLLVNNLDVDLNPLFYHSPFKEDGHGPVESQKVLDLNLNGNFSHNVFYSRNGSLAKNLDNNCGGMPSGNPTSYKDVGGPSGNLIIYKDVGSSVSNASDYKDGCGPAGNPTNYKDVVTSAVNPISYKEQKIESHCHWNQLATIDLTDQHRWVDIPYHGTQLNIPPKNPPSDQCILLDNGDIYNNPKYFSDHGVDPGKQESTYQLTEPPEESAKALIMKGPTNPIFTIQEDQGESSESLINLLGAVEISSSAPQNSTIDKQQSSRGSLEYQGKKPPLSKHSGGSSSLNIDDKANNDVFLTNHNHSTSKKSTDSHKQPSSMAMESSLEPDGIKNHLSNNWGSLVKNTPKNNRQMYHNDYLHSPTMDNFESMVGDGLRCSQSPMELLSINKNGTPAQFRSNNKLFNNRNSNHRTVVAIDYGPSVQSSKNWSNGHGTNTMEQLTPNTFFNKSNGHEINTMEQLTPNTFFNKSNGHEINTMDPPKPKIFNYLSLANTKEISSPHGGYVVAYGSNHQQKLTKTPSIQPCGKFQATDHQFHGNKKIHQFNGLMVEDAQDLDNKYLKYNPTSPVLTDQTMASSGNNKASSLNKNFYSSMKQSIDMAKNTFNQSMINGIGSPIFKPQFYNLPQKFVKESSIYQGTNHSMTSNGHSYVAKKYKKIIGDFKQLNFFQQCSANGFLAILEKYIQKIQGKIPTIGGHQRLFFLSIIEKIQNIMIMLMEKVPRENWSIFLNDIKVIPDIHQFKKVQSIIDRWQGAMDWPKDLHSIQNNIIIYLYFTLQNKKFLLEFFDETTMEVFSPKQWAQSWDTIFQSTGWIMEYLENMEVEWPPEDMTPAIVKKTNQLGKKLEKLMEKAQDIIDESINSFEQYNDNYENFMELFSEIPLLESQLIKQEFYEQNTDSFLSFTNDKFFPVDRKLKILKKYFYKIRLYVATPEEAMDFRFNNLVKFLDQWVVQTNTDFSQLKNNYYTEQLMVLMEEFLGDINWILLGFDSLVHMEFLGSNGHRMV